MKTITERELKLLARHGLVESLTLRRHESGGWWVEVISRDGNRASAQLVTQRNSPRTWSSLHRLVLHAEAHYGAAELEIGFSA